MRILFSSSKPISSPGRTDKFPPPLMRFLRTNVGSRSRSRGRTKKAKSSLLFMRRKKATTTLETTQEPSSPKVTCIGQVRVRRSRSKSGSKSKATSNNKPPEKNTNCCCSCCHCFGCFPKTSNMCKLEFWRKKNKPGCWKWKRVWFFNCRSVKVRTDSSKFGSNRFEPTEAEEVENDTEEGVTKREQSILIDTMMTTTTPPKNALLLTRCRSAPYRSSSLACRFWGSPETEERERTTSALGIERCCTSTSSRDSTSESRLDQHTEIDNGNSSDNGYSRVSFKKDEIVGVCAHFELQNENGNDNIGGASSISIIVNNHDDINDDNDGPSANSEEVKEINEDVEDDGSCEFPKPLMLRRSKSEPARSDSQKFNPEDSEFWRLTKLGNTSNT